MGEILVPVDDELPEVRIGSDAGPILRLRKSSPPNWHGTDAVLPLSITVERPVSVTKTVGVYWDEFRSFIDKIEECYKHLSGEAVLEDDDHYEVLKFQFRAGGHVVVSGLL